MTSISEEWSFSRIDKPINKRLEAKFEDFIIGLETLDISIAIFEKEIYDKILGDVCLVETQLVALIRSLRKD